MSIYVPKHFELYEVLPPVMYGRVKKLGIIAWQMFDPYCLVTNDRLRERFGPIIINDWFWDGRFKYSGWRPFNCPDGAFLSIHKRGAGFDLKFSKVRADEVRADMRANPDLPCFEYIHRVEEFEGMSWFHFDRGNIVPGTGPVFFSPGGSTTRAAQ